MDKSEVWYGMMICYVLHLLTIYRQKYTNRVPKRGRSGAWAGPRRSTVAEVQRHWALLGDFRWQHDSMNSIGCLGISGKHQSNIISPTFWWIMWNIYWFIILYTLSFSVNQWKKMQRQIIYKPMKKMQRQIIYSAKQIKTAIYWFITFQERQLTPCRGRDARHTQPFLGSCSPADFSNQADEHPSHGHVREKCGNRGYL